MVGSLQVLLDYRRLVEKFVNQVIIRFGTGPRLCPGLRVWGRKVERVR